MKTVAAAPGKLVLLGEYAVLFGAPALVMAVDRRAQVEILDCETPGIEIRAPDVAPAPCHFTVDTNGVLHCAEGESAAQPFVLVTAIIHALLSAGIMKPEALALKISIDTSAFFHADADGNRHKLGLGSSAALTVALASGLTAHVGRDELFEDPDYWLQQLLGFHRQFQNGRGSGVDVAASLYGGVIRYQLDTARSGHADPIQWPANLLRLPIWTGKSASTPKFLEALDAWSERDPETFSTLLGELGSLADAGASAATIQSAELLLAAAAQFATCLQKIGDAAKIPIMSNEHARIRELAMQAGCEYKPCGAGGGDLGLALTRDPQSLVALGAALADSAFAAPVELAEDNEGLRILTSE